MSKSTAKRPKGRRPQALDHWPALRQELITLSAELDRFPTLHDLEKLGRYDVMRALVHHGGMLAVARRLHAETEAVTAAVGGGTSADPGS
jgi:hypothetical protein